MQRLFSLVRVIICTCISFTSGVVTDLSPHGCVFQLSAGAVLALVSVMHLPQPLKGCGILLQLQVTRCNFLRSKISMPHASKWLLAGHLSCHSPELS